MGMPPRCFRAAPVLAERNLWVAATTDPKGLARITLTYPAIESSQNLAFLVAGKDKRAIFTRFRHGDRALPAVHVHPVGDLWQFVDAAAAPIRPLTIERTEHERKRANPGD